MGQPCQPFHLLAEQRRVAALPAVGHDHHDGASSQPSARPAVVELLDAGAETGAAGPVRRRGHRRPQGDRRLAAPSWRVRRCSDVANTNASARNARTAPCKQVQVGTAIRLHRSRHVGEEDDLARSASGAAGAGCGPGRRRSGGRPAGVARRSIVGPDERATAAAAAPARRRHDQVASIEARAVRARPRCTGRTAPRPQPLLGAGGGDGVRSVHVVPIGRRLLDDGLPASGSARPPVAGRGRPGTGSVRVALDVLDHRAAPPNTSSKTRLNMARSSRSTTRVTRASQNSSSTRWAGGGRRRGEAPAHRRGHRRPRGVQAVPTEPRRPISARSTDRPRSPLAHDPGEYPRSSRPAPGPRGT